MSRKHPGSRHYAALDRRRWQIARLRCFEAAGWRCSRCGVAGRLEAHHRVRLEDGGDPYAQANLECLCRSCHIAHHRGDRERPDPARDAWRALLRELR